MEEEDPSAGRLTKQQTSARLKLPLKSPHLHVLYLLSIAKSLRINRHSPRKMDPDPEIFPVLAFVLSQVDPNTYPFVPPNIYQDLISDMPHLANPVVVSSLVQSVPTNVDQTRSFLSALGPPPEPSSVAAARAKLEHPGDETELGMYRAVVRLDEIYAEYGKQLRDAEQALAAVYGSVVEDLDHEEEVDEEVVKILKAAETEVVKRVDLSWRQLRLIPEAFGKLNGLLVLNLSHNQLEVIPDSVGGLKKLEELNLSSNLLKSLPDSIGLLWNLKTLNLSGNKLNSLPESIAGCSGLKELDSSYNNLTFLPTNIGFGLTNLEKLNISLNKICILPTSICEIKSLRLLDAHFNELHGLPPAIGKLSYLETMNVSNNFNNMTTLPDSIGDLMNLRHLDLSNNQLRSLPDAFMRLENLSSLNLEQNPLVIPPPEVANKGAQAVREFLTKRRHDMIVEEQERSRVEALKIQQARSGWFGWGHSKVRGLVSDVSQGVGGYLYSGTESRDPCLDEPR